MIFDDLLAVNTIISLGLTDRKSRDERDPEVERWFNSSPPLLEQCIMFDRARVIGNGKKVEAKDDVAVSVDDESLDVEAEEKKADNKAAAFRRRLASISMEDCFRPVPLPCRGSSDSAEEHGRSGGGGCGGKKVSALTELLTLSAPNTTQLTIYLPAFTTMSLYAADSSNFEEIKMLIMRVHEQQKVQPPLHYHAVDYYEIRMHEGDGEPDMDMPALGRTKTLAQYKVDNEYCLCEVEGKSVPPPPPRQSPTLGSTSSSFFPPMSIALPPVPPSYNASPALGGGMGFMPATRKPARGTAPPVAYDPDAAARETAAVMRIPESSANSFNSSCFSTASSDCRFASGRNFDRANSMVETIKIIVGYVHETVEIHPNMMLRDLLPEINKKNRLRIFSDEFAFALTEEDQARLKIMSPITDLRVSVQSLGVRVLELQRRVYVDTNVKATHKPPLPSTNALTNANVANIPMQTNKEKEKKISAPEERPAPKGIADVPQTVVVTNQLAPMYQEWLVVKKNKYGLRQDRIFGVDGTKVYNMKRGHTRANPDVQRAEREISAIRKVDILDDRKTLRISWNDERDVYDIDYTCANHVECGELVAKLLFLKDEAAKKRRAEASMMFPGRR